MLSSLILVVVAMMPLGIVPPAEAASGWAVFGSPNATSTFGEGVTFTQPVTVSAAARRAELLLTAANAIGPAVIEAAGSIDEGASTLTYLLDPTVDGHILPNTHLTARWRLVGADDPTDVEVGPPVEITYADDRFDWRTEVGPLVRIHWYEGSDEFGARALAIGEDGLRQAADLLQVTEDEPIDFYVYADVDSLYDALGPGTHENVGGEAHAEIRTMFGLISPADIDDPLVATTIPHELTHLVFDTAASNPYHFPPAWLNEGLAVYLSQGYDRSDRRLVEAAVRGGALIALDGLIGRFPSKAAFFLAYAESVSAVDYLVRTYGVDALVSLIRSYADGHTDDEAFSAALGVDMSAFGEAWLEDLGAAAPKRYGPQPAPPGPIPSAWLGEAGVPGASDPGVPGASDPGVPGAGTSTDATGSFLPILLVVVVIAVGLIVVVVTVRRRRLGSRSS